MARVTEIGSRALALELAKGAARCARASVLARARVTGREVKLAAATRPAGVAKDTQRHGYARRLNGILGVAKSDTT